MRWPWQHADPEEILELEAENVLLDEYIDSDGEKPYPDLSGVNREVASGAKEIAETNVRAQNFVTPFPEPFHVDMAPLSKAAPPKKRELFKPPILDGHYFARKRRAEEANAMSYRSASMSPFGSASYYGSSMRGGGASYVIGRTMERYGCEAGHIVQMGSDVCVNCGRHPWE